MNKDLRLPVALFSLMILATTALALGPADVVIVANSNNQDSVSLAEFYASERGIPEDQIILLDTSIEYEIGRGDYQNQIAKPLKQALQDRQLTKKVSCVVLMWGIPGRISETQQDKFSYLYRKEQQKAHMRLAVNYELLGTVTRKFPEPKTKSLKPIGKLFSSPMPEPSKPLLKIKDLRKNINNLLAMRESDVARIEDPKKRLIASRQLMALHLDLFGLNGLIDYITKSRPDLIAMLKPIEKRLSEIEAQKSKLRVGEFSIKKTEEMLQLIEETDGVMLVHSYAESKVKPSQKPSSPLESKGASVDSELALLWWPYYKLKGPLNNPLHWMQSKRLDKAQIPTVLMTARIDGPTAADARRIIENSIEAEKAGLNGKFYVDAGGGKPLTPDIVDKYDRHLEKLYSFIKANSEIDITLEDSPVVFQKNSCPDSALYVGWYSLKKYIPAFIWQQGAVGWHIASWEAVNLRDPASREWCPKMIQNGVAATLGAVREPMLGAFPLPEEFFPLLLTGKYTVAECYWMTTPLASWQMVLFADPLYNPFKNNPQISPEVLPFKL